MTTTPAPRKPLPEPLETQILVASRRRCCLCFHLDGDTARKPGQIAHIDRNRANHSESNLAFLCLPHHDEYDSRTSQSKGITQAELTHAKSALLAYIGEAFSADTVSISIRIKGDFDALSAQQREELLRDALKAADVKHSVKVLSSSRGSIVYRVVLTGEDAVAVLEAFNSGRLRDSGVLAVSELPTALKDVHFSDSFSKYSHGIEKREAARTILNPDSAMFFDGSKQTSPSLAAFGLFLRRIDATYSLIVITDHTSAVSSTFPIPHDEVPLESGVNPYQALARLVDRYGGALRLDGTSSKLRLGERIAMPRGMSDLEAVRFLESRAEESLGRHNYELVCLMEQGTILSDYRIVHLLFALAKPTYVRSIARLGLRTDESPRGRYVSRKRRDA